MQQSPVEVLVLLLQEKQRRNLRRTFGPEIGGPGDGVEAETDVQVLPVVWRTSGQTGRRFVDAVALMEAQDFGARRWKEIQAGRGSWESCAGPAKGR